MHRDVETSAASALDHSHKDRNFKRWKRVAPSEPSVRLDLGTDSDLGVHQLSIHC